MLINDDTTEFRVNTIQVARLYKNPTLIKFVSEIFVKKYDKYANYSL